MPGVTAGRFVWKVVPRFRLCYGLEGGRKSMERWRWRELPAPCLLLFLLPCLMPTLRCLPTCKLALTLYLLPCAVSRQPQACNDIDELDTGMPCCAAVFMWRGDGMVRQRYVTRWARPLPVWQLNQRQNDALTCAASQHRPTNGPYMAWRRYCRCRRAKRLKTSPGNAVPLRAFRFALCSIA
jgi:hypothetical protein